MKSVLRFSGVLRLSVIFAVIFFTPPLAGQQNTSTPKIYIISPAAEDSLNNSGMILFKAEIMSGSPVKSYRIFINREPFINGSGKNLKKNESGTYIVENNLELKKGQNTIYMEVKNESATFASDRIIIFSQIEPFVRWIAPAETSTTVQTGEVTLKADIKTLLPIQDLNLNLNGTTITLDKETYKSTGTDTYTFEKRVQLPREKNTLTLFCSNARGGTTSATRIVTNTYTSNPVVKIISPLLSDSLNNTGLVTVKAAIQSKTPIKSFRILRNGETAVSEANKKLEKQDSITYLLDSYLDIKKGLNEIYVQATNESGAGTSEKRIINCKSEPFVTWLMPGLESSDVESEVITLRAEIKSNTPLKKTIINVNGTPMTDDKASVQLPEKDTYPLEKTIQLRSGKNTIFITCLNARGETRSLTRYVNCTAGAIPVITLITPTAKDSLSVSGLVAVTAEIVSKFELQTFRIFNNRNVMVSDNASTLQKKDSITYIVQSFVPLQVGQNTVFVEARNSAGMGTSPRRVINCRLEPVIRWILPSSVTTRFDAGSMTIRAEISSGFDLSGVKISINGNTFAVDKDALKRTDNLTWVLETPIALSAGTNNIILMADNIRVTGKSDSRQVIYTPGVKPEITWIAPVALSSETEKPEFQLSATIKTKSQVNKAALFINGTELTTGGKPKLSQKNTQEYIYDNVIQLRPGENKIRLSASAGTESVESEERVITYNVPVLPEMSWKNPAPDNSQVNRPSADLKIEIRSKDALKSLSVYLNGKAIENINLQNSVRKENDYFVLENAIPVGPGENSVYVTAANNAGVTRSEVRNIKYVIPPEPSVAANTVAVRPSENNDKKAVEIKDEKVSEPKQVVDATPSPPVLYWVSPSAEKNNINENNARIKARINATGRMQSVLLYVNGIATEMINQLTPSGNENEYLLERLINLNPGENSIYFVATNAGGATRSEMRYLTNPPTSPPVITWAIPSETKVSVNKEVIMIEVCIKSASELKSAMIYVNGIPQVSEMVFQAPQQGDCNYRLIKPIILKDGKNSLIVNATNFAGSNNSDPREILYQTTLIAEKRLALVFGNSDYMNGTSLKNPANDANLIEGTLKTLGFEVIKRLNAKKSEMEQAIREFSERLPEYNVALFYYAGHGMNVDGMNYLLPTDAVLNKKSDCQWEAIEVNKIVAQFEQVPENINIIILDACRNNPYKSWVRGGEQGFKMLSPVSGTLISYATAEGATAADGAGLNGPFTEELVKQMVIPQSIFEVFINTGNQVRKRTNNMQQPTYQVNLTGNFWFKK